MFFIMLIINFSIWIIMLFVMMMNNFSIKTGFLVQKTIKNNHEISPTHKISGP